jgi:hypothetical protein
VHDAFLVFRQPFILGRHPTAFELDAHMHSKGWTPHQEPCLRETLQCLGSVPAVSQIG